MTKCASMNYPDLKVSTFVYKQINEIQDKFLKHQHSFEYQNIRTADSKIAPKRVHTMP